MITDNELIASAISARKNAYAPYSGFKVGAALLTVGGRIYTGCNVENAAYGETVCAERNAFFKAVSEGERNFVKIAIVGGGDTLTLSYPCGSCRQVMTEFCNEKLEILISDGNKTEKHTLRELLPHSFNVSAL